VLTVTKGLAMPRNVIVRKRPERERPSGSKTAVLRRCRPETGWCSTRRRCSR